MLSRWVTSTLEQPWQERDCAKRSECESNLRPTGERGRMWLGFGGCFNELGWIALSGLAQSARQEVLRALFDPANGCKFNFCRLPIGASDYAAEWYSHNESPADLEMKQFSIERDRGCLIPYIQEALKLKPDLRLLASPWSPPTWLKFPKAYNYGTLIWEPRFLKAYALYFVRFVQAYAGEGITIHQIHPQNEPVADQKFPSCVWTGEQMRDFIRDYLKPAFDEHRIESEIWLGTINSEDYNGWAGTVLADDDARACISGVGYQWAGKGALQRTTQSWPDIPVIQTENECGDGRNTWNYAHYVFDLIRHYISNGAVGYVYWNMVLQPNGRSTWGWNQNAMVTIDAACGQIVYNPEFYVMKHCSHFIEPNATRLELTGQWAAHAVAFENPDGTSVIVLSNPFEEPRKLTFVEEGQSFTVEVPARSFNTFVC